MKAALFNESFPPVIDGVSNVVLNYADILSRTPETEAVVATPRYPDTDYGKYPFGVVPYRSMAASELTGGYRTGNPFDMEALTQLVSFKPDILHAHSPATAVLMARIVRQAVDAPLVYTYHTKYDIDIARTVKGELLQKEAIRALVENVSACDEVWAVSRGAGDNLRSLGYEGNVRVMANGVDFPKGEADPELVQEVTKDFDLPEGVFVFLFVGRLVNYKGLPLILDALRLLSDDGEDFRMVFVGNGDDAASLKETALSYGFRVDAKRPDGVIEHLGTASSRSGKIIFAGAERDRTKLRAWNTRADLFLFPSTFDTNGLVVREAAACALPSVLVRGSCAAEGVADGRNGYLIAENAESMHQLLRELVSDREAVRKAGQHAMGELYMSWETCVANARDRYEAVIELKKSGAFAGHKKVAADYFLGFTSDLTKQYLNVIDRSRTFVDGMQGNAHEIAQGTRNLTRGVQETAQGIARGVQEGTQEIARGVQETAQNLAKGVQETAHGIARDMQDIAVGEAERRIRESQEFHRNLLDMHESRAQAEENVREFRQMLERLKSLLIS